ncbi:MAG: Trk system potassium transporter TrkA [Planctomycetota bacterium]|jgi:trk system potassium uptake protein TrkA
MRRSIIVGAGQVGFNIASRLVNEGHDVVVIDRDEARLERATESLDVQGLRGHGARTAVLEEAGIADASMLMAVTDSDEVNLVACMAARILGSPALLKIARLREPSYLEDRFVHSEHSPVDLAINPERVTADKILRLLRYPLVTEMMEFAAGRVVLLGLPILPTSPLAGMRFVDLAPRFPDLDLLVAAIHRDGRVLIPTGGDVILPDDTISLVCATDRVESTLRHLAVPTEPTRRIMIAGGSRTGRFVAGDVGARGVEPKLIVPDARLADWLAGDLPKALVLHGSPADAALLETENIAEMEVFIAAEKDEETSVLSALLAKRLGARRVIAVTNRSEYLPILHTVGIDVSISPRMMAVNSILHAVRRRGVVAVRALDDAGDAEALEFEAITDCRVIGKPLRAVKLPPNSLIAAVLRGGDVLVPRGDTVIEAGDHVIAVALRAAVEGVERAFAVES